ncbi:MAG TPA: hypothetical protein PLS50_06450 [Candidatus Dojkabacteria bacterium]|nr:hypothetical protein [Candidatus Dojkabacteria bacterium]
MTNIIDRQTLVFSFNLNTLLPSIASVPINLRFAADELVLKSLSYTPSTGTGGDVADMVQIWCNKTNDNLLTSFPNDLGQSYQHDEHFRLNNSLQNESITFSFQTTANGAPSFSNPQPLISPGAVVGNTKGIVCLTIDFIKLKNKEIY